MNRRSQIPWAVGTLAAVAIALSLDSLFQSRDRFDTTHAPQVAIRRQLDAFNRGDYGSAYQFAADEIQARLPLPEFHRMVVQNYPLIAHSRSAAFEASEVGEGNVAVPVTVTGQDGTVGHYVYMMQYERNGWRVTAVEGGYQPGGSAGPYPQKPARSHHGGKGTEQTASARARGQN